jgi:uncharacterized RDD family membrane protein YckC
MYEEILCYKTNMDFEKGGSMICDLQKASMWKRCSAALFDGILLCIVIVLFAWIISTALGFDEHSATLDACYAQYEETYGVTLRLSLADYEALGEEELGRLNAAYDALAADERAVYAYNMMMQLTPVVTSLSILLGYMVMEFTIPMCLGNGQTLGKKIFSIGVMRQDGVKLSGTTLFIRTVLGKYTIETMIPVLMIIMIFFGSIGLVGPAIIGAIVLCNIIMLIATRTNAAIHDGIASTVCVDLPSQMIFNSREDMLAYRKKLHAEKVAKETC